MEKKRFLAVVMTVMMIISMVPSMVLRRLRQENWVVSLKLRGLLP